MLQDDFDKLMKKFETSDPSQVNMEEIMGEVMTFFSGLKQEIIEATPEEREQIFANLSGMYTKLMGMTSKLASDLGISEQELLNLAEDMKSFSPEQRHLIEKTKSKMMTEVQDLGRVLQESSEEEKGKVSHKPGPQEKKKKPPEGRHGVTRSKWDRA